MEFSPIEKRALYATTNLPIGELLLEQVVRPSEFGKQYRWEVSFVPKESDRVVRLGRAHAPVVEETQYGRRLYSPDLVPLPDGNQDNLPSSYPSLSRLITHTISEADRQETDRTVDSLLTDATQRNDVRRDIRQASNGFLNLSESFLTLLAHQAYELGEKVATLAPDAIDEKEGETRLLPRVPQYEKPGEVPSDYFLPSLTPREIWSIRHLQWHTKRAVLATATMASSTHPQENQDTIVGLESGYQIHTTPLSYRGNGTMMVVADGLSMSPQATRASRMAAESISSYLRATAPARSILDAIIHMEDAFLRANEQIFTYMEGNGQTAATAVQLLEHNGVTVALVGSVGNVRARVVRPAIDWKGKSTFTIHRITDDDNVLTELLHQEKITPHQYRQVNYNIDTRNTHKTGNETIDGCISYVEQPTVKNLLTSALGKDRVSVTPRISVVVLKPGDRIVVSSDGEYQALPPQEEVLLAQRGTDFPRYSLTEAEQRTRIGLGVVDDRSMGILIPN